MTEFKVKDIILIVVIHNEIIMPKFFELVKLASLGASELYERRFDDGSKDLIERVTPATPLKDFWLQAENSDFIKYEDANKVPFHPQRPEELYIWEGNEIVSTEDYGELQEVNSLEKIKACHQIGNEEF